MYKITAKTWGLPGLATSVRASQDDDDDDDGDDDDDDDDDGDDDDDDDDDDNNNDDFDISLKPLWLYGKLFHGAGGFWNLLETLKESRIAVWLIPYDM